MASSDVEAAERFRLSDKMEEALLSSSPRRIGRLGCQPPSASALRSRSSDPYPLPKLEGGHLQRQSGMIEGAFRFIRGLIRRPYYGNPRSYWNRRHRRFGDSLDGVGQLGLGDVPNERDYEVKWEHVKSMLEELGVQPSWSVIDAGCGSGWFAERLAVRGHAIHGVDFSQKAVSLARNRLGARATFEVSSLDSWSVDSRADLVICIDVLFHIVENGKWRQAVDSVSSAVAPNGLLLIQEHLTDQHDEDSADHVRWRSIVDYEDALPGWHLIAQKRYLLPEAGTHKDIIVWQRL